MNIVTDSKSIKLMKGTDFTVLIESVLDRNGNVIDADTANFIFEFYDSEIEKQIKSGRVITDPTRIYTVSYDGTDRVNNYINDDGKLVFVFNAPNIIDSKMYYTQKEWKDGAVFDDSIDNVVTSGALPISIYNRTATDFSNSYTGSLTIFKGEIAVKSVNGKTGDVVLSASDVDAIPELDRDTFALKTDIPTDFYSKELVDDKDAATLQSAKDFTTEEIGKIPTPDVSGQIETHNTSTTSHTDIRQSVANVVTALSQKEDSGVASGLVNQHNVSSTAHQDIRTELATKVSTTEMNNAISAVVENLDWKEAVDTFTDIATTYPNAEDGWTVTVKDTDYTYRYNGTTWVVISANAIPIATTEVDGKMSKEDKTKLDAALIAQYKSESLADLNSMLEEGFYGIMIDSNTNNAPTGLSAAELNGNWELIVGIKSGGYKTQRLTKWYVDKYLIFIRETNGGSGSTAWKQIVEEDTFNDELGKKVDKVDGKALSNIEGDINELEGVSSKVVSIKDLNGELLAPITSAAVVFMESDTEVISVQQVIEGLSADKADSLINISSTDTAVVVNCENNRRYKFGVITSLDLSKAPLFDDNSICELRFETNGTLPTITLGDDLIGLSEYDIAVNSYVTMIVSGSIITCGSVAKEV